MISPGELQIGLWVTVHHWEWLVSPVDISGNTICKIRGDGSWVGALLQVSAISLPFVVVIQHTPGRNGETFKNTIQLDTRQAILHELGPEFVKSALKL